MKKKMVLLVIVSMLGLIGCRGKSNLIAVNNYDGREDFNVDGEIFEKIDEGDGSYTYLFWDDYENEKDPIAYKLREDQYEVGEYIYLEGCRVEDIYEGVIDEGKVECPEFSCRSASIFSSEEDMFKYR